MNTPRAPKSQDFTSLTMERIFSSVPDLFGLLVEQCRLTERMAIQLEAFLQTGDLAVVEEIRNLEAEGVILHQRNQEWFQRTPAIPFDRESLLQSSLFMEALQGTLAGIVVDLDGHGTRGDWHILEMAAQMRHAIALLRGGHERLIASPSAIGPEVTAILRARKSLEKSYRFALAQLLNNAEQDVQNQLNPEAMQQIFHVFRLRELYRRFRDAGIEIANCGRVLQDIALQFA